ENIKVAIIVENAGIQKLVLELLPTTRLIGTHQVVVGIGRLRVLVERLHIGMGGRAIEVEVVLLHVLAVIALGVSESKQSLFQDGILLVPERQREAEAHLFI